ncbi:unnamed protein product, partial [marine sediment metagenome]
RSPQAFVISPDLKDLGVRQQEFQIELRRQLDNAREQLQWDTEKVRKARQKVEIRTEEIRGDADTDVVARAKSVLIFVDDEGHITLEIEEDGVSKKYEFNSREDFQKSKPELYERFRKHLESSTP